MEFDFSKFFYRGLDFNDPNIASVIADHYEYKRLETKPFEPLPARGFPFNHQREIMQIFLFIKNLIIIHDAGSGKTCTISNSLEQFRQSLTSAVADYTTQYLMPNKVPFRKFVILVKGPILKEAMVNQIIYKCNAKGVFDTKELRSAKTQTMRTLILKRTFYQYFTIVGYDKFASEIQSYLNPPRDERWTDELYKEFLEKKEKELVEKYSHSIFVADEIHTLTTEKDKNTKSRYRYINQFFHLPKITETSKIILSTATPMKNKSSEFVDILNMILPMDGQLDPALMSTAFPPLVEEEGEKEKKIKLNPEKAREKLLPYFRGKISYLRAMDIFVDVQSNHNDVDIMEVVEGSYPFYVRRVPIPSSSKDYIKEYKQLKRMNNTEKEGEGALVVKRNDVYSGERQLANLWLPPPKGEKGKTMKDRFERYFSYKDGVYELNPGFEDFYQKYMELTRRKTPQGQLPSFALISPKSVEAAEILKKNEGKAVIFSNWVQTGIGIISVCLNKIYGYSHFGKKSDIRDKDGKVKLEKKLRFAVLEQDSKWNGKLLENFNSYENRYGDYIKVLLIPQFGREGINTNEVFTFINFDGHWNPTNYLQALSRVLRADAFQWSLKERRRKALEEGKNVENVRLTVDVYNLSTVIPDAERDEDDETSEIDEMLYLTSMLKDKDIQRVMRLIKETAIDCYVHYNRNVRANDEDYSSACNYEKCQFSCAVEREPTGVIDYDMYDLLYSEPEVRVVKSRLKNLFKDYPFYTFTELRNILTGYRDIVLIKALNDIIENKTPLVDNFGVNVYLREDSGMFYVQRGFPTQQSSYALSEYVYHTPIVAEKSLSDVLIEVAVSDMEKVVSENRQNQVDIDNLDLLQKITYVEQMFKRKILEGEVPEEGKPFFSRYVDRIYELGELENFLTEQANSTAVWEKRGRKPENLEDAKFKPIGKDQADEIEKFNALGLKGSKVWVHALLTYETTAEFERFHKGEGIIRVMKESEGYEWRDANAYERVVYNKFIQVEIQKYMERLNQDDFYGFFLDGELKIIDVKNRPKLKEKRKGNEEKKGKGTMDLRTRTKGVKCEEFIQGKGNLQRFHKYFHSQGSTCEELREILERNKLLIYLNF